MFDPLFFAEKRGYDEFESVAVRCRSTASQIVCDWCERIWILVSGVLAPPKYNKFDRVLVIVCFTMLTGSVEYESIVPCIRIVLA